jgi:hypothetical protein
LAAEEKRPSGLTLKTAFAPSPILIVLVLSAVLNVYAIWWGLPSLRGWGTDEVVPATVIKALGLRFSNGWTDIYPPFHYMLLGAVYLPFLGLQKIGLLDISGSFGSTLLFCLGRLLSVLMAAGTVYTVYRCGREIVQKRAAVLSALLTALLVPFVYYAKVANLDMAFFFWVTLSIHFYIRILKRHRPADYILFAAAAALSVATKDQAYGFYVLTPLAILWSLHRFRKKARPEAGFPGTLLDRRVILAFLTAIVVFVLATNLLWNAKGYMAHVKIVTGWASAYGRIFERTVSGNLAMLWQTLKHLKFSWGWPGAAAALGGVLFALVRKRKNPLLLALLVPWVSYYVFLISVTLANYDRYLVPLWILLAYFGGDALAEILRPERRLFKVRAAILGILLAYSLVYAFSVNILMQNDSRYRAEAWMKKNIDPAATIAVADPKEYLPRLDGWPWIRLFPPTSQVLQRRAPAYVVIVAEIGYKLGRKEPRARLYFDLDAGTTGYKPVFGYKFRSPWVLLDFRGIYTNLDKINPYIRIFKRVASPP